LVQTHEPLISLSDLARRTLFSEPQLRGMVRRGELESVKIGRRVLVLERSARERLSILFRPVA
jgi:hypothetical protein